MYHLYMYGPNGTENFRELDSSTLAISLALDWKAKGEKNVAEVYYVTNGKAMRVL